MGKRISIVETGHPNDNTYPIKAIYISNNYNIAKDLFLECEGYYTLGFWVKGNTNGKMNVRFGNNLETIYFTNEWDFKEVTVFINKEYLKQQLILSFDNSGTYIFRIKLEKGQKATDYVKNENDIDYKVNGSFETLQNLINVNKDGITQLEKKTNIETKEGVKSIQEAYSLQTQTIDEIDGKVVNFKSELDGQEVRLKSAEQKITDEAITNQIVSNSTKKYKVRYIMDCINGSNVNDSCHWVEIQAINNLGRNVALNKTVTSNKSLSNSSYITNGNLSYSNYGGCTKDYSGGTAYVIVDLGEVYDNIDKVIIYHYYGDNRIYNSPATYVSEDKINWIPIYKGGTYKETKYGNVIPVNDTIFINRMTRLDEEGFHCIDTGIDIQTSTGEKKMYADTNGNLTYSGQIKSKLKDGSYTVLDSNGLYQLVGSNKNEYHHLTYYGSFTATFVPQSHGLYALTTKTITVPNEFKGKKFNVISYIRECSIDSYSRVGNKSFHLDIDRANNQFRISYGGSSTTFAEVCSRSMSINLVWNSKESFTIDYIIIA